jgi:Tfp pilus assembly protein PilF
MRAYYRDLPDRGDSPIVPYCRARLADDEHTRFALLEQAIDRDRSFYYGHLAKARLNRGLGYLDKAQASLASALAAKPESPECNLEMAEVLRELGQYAAAEPYYSNYLSARPDDRHVGKVFAQLLIYHLGRAAQARALLEPYLRKDPEDTAVLMDLAAVDWLVGDEGAAIARYHKVLELDRGIARAALNLANLYYESVAEAEPKRRDEAWARARKAFLYYRGLARTHDVHDMIDLHLAVPFRLHAIEAALGPDDGAPPQPGHNF